MQNNVMTTIDNTDSNKRNFDIWQLKHKMHLYHNNKAAKQISTNKICTEKQLLSVENSGIFRMCESEGASGVWGTEIPQ